MFGDFWSFLDLRKLWVFLVLFSIILVIGFLVFCLWGFLAKSKDSINKGEVEMVRVQTDMLSAQFTTKVSVRKIQVGWAGSFSLRREGFFEGEAYSFVLEALEFLWFT